MNKEVEKALEKLESYVSEEMDKIRKLAKQEVKLKDLFSIVTYSEVCKELKEKEKTCPYKKIKQIEKLFNGEWKKDWLDRNQQKWYPWFEYKAGRGLVFDASVYHDYCSSGQVAFYKDKLTSDHIGKNFLDIYKEIGQ